MRARGVSAAVLLTLLSASPLLAQHEGHQRPAGQSDQAINPAVLASCVEAQRQTMMLVDGADRRLETARQSNHPAAMRAAMDDLQTTLGAIRTQLKTCMPGMQQGASPPPSPPPSSTHAMPGMDHGEKGPQAPENTTDPVCGMKVDPETAPAATYHGKTYHFCSEGDRQKFLNDPAKYVPQHEH